MNKKIALFVLVLGMIIQSAVVANAGTATIENKGEHSYKSARILPAIYHSANTDLSDLRIKNDKGGEVPYFINTGYQKRQSESHQYDMELINSYLKDKAFYFDYILKTASDSDVIATSIVAESNNINFAKSVEIYGSYDNKNWQKIKDDTLYCVDNHIKTTISFEEPQKYTYYRFKLSNNAEQISFHRVYLEYNETQTETDYFLEEIKPDYTVREQGSNTEIAVEGLKNLKLAEIIIVSDSMFKRMLVTPLGAKEIYHLTFGSETYQDTTIPMDWQISTEENFVMTIQNNDDAPIKIDNIIVRYYADELVFDGSNSDSFTLEYGASEDKTAPEYDIANYKNLTLKQDMDALKITTIATDEKEEKAVDYKWIFNVVIVVIGVLLGAIILSNVKKTQS
ncbi:discoidin domain-containing protein [Aminipila sp.]|uniref:discoidin domain-containing protein n=1 Tax=Aminipila sp. TaxID=2060095 RepID=UPI0028968B49|nr:discoidin domain-containing protein [Aminipila sp.]